MAKAKSDKETAHHFDFSPPSKLFARGFIAPFKFYFSPQFYGLDELDVTRPALYVSNHTILGVFDGYPFAIELYLRKGIILRALADSTHWLIPVWKDIIEKNLGGGRSQPRKLPCADA
jgi:1-acyl-sn-glycerol-3-phosphate acyltransferase